MLREPGLCRHKLAGWHPPREGRCAGRAMKQQRQQQQHSKESGRAGTVVRARREDGVSSSSFPFDLMDRQMREFDRMEREMDASFERLAAETNDMFQQAESQAGGMRVETREERFSNGYSYSRTVVIANNGTWRSQPPAHGFGFGNLGLLVGLLVAIVTYLFSRGFEVTTFREERKWVLLLLWPVLIIFSKSFRKQLKKAVKKGGKAVFD